MIIHTYGIRCDYCAKPWAGSPATDPGINQRTAAQHAGWISLPQPGGTYQVRRRVLDICNECAPKPITNPPESTDKGDD